MTTRLCGWLVLPLLGLSGPVLAVNTIDVTAIFQTKALVKLDGRKRLLKVGDAPVDGVRLLEADTRSETIVVEINGKPRKLRLGVVGTAVAGGGKQKVLLYSDGSGHYRANGTINGAPVSFMVDTGATTIALNGNTARSIGLDYRRLGRRGLASTAGGIVSTYRLTLDRVQVGEITLYNVEAAVIEGNFPQIPLLGMSFLGQLEMRRDSNYLELIKN